MARVGRRVRYTYLGAKGTDTSLVGRPCDPVRRKEGKVIRGRGNALVLFEGEHRPRVVVAPRLRLER